MNISARIENSFGSHSVVLATNGREHALTISPKPDAPGSRVNGGELLFLALATCYCNDLYREARKRNIEIKSVCVEVTGEFGEEGEGARNIRYRAMVDSSTSRENILELMRHTDTVAEIQNTLRVSNRIELADCEIRDLSQPGSQA
jgi:uncharacterized OsmC-like protein